jgi:hypothetical protein
MGYCVSASEAVTQLNVENVKECKYFLKALYIRNMFIQQMKMCTTYATFHNSIILFENTLVDTDLRKVVVGW